MSPYEAQRLAHVQGWTLTTPTLSEHLVYAYRYAEGARFYLCEIRDLMEHDSAWLRMLLARLEERVTTATNLVASEWLDGVMPALPLLAKHEDYRAFVRHVAAREELWDRMHEVLREIGDEEEEF